MDIFVRGMSIKKLRYMPRLFLNRLLKFVILVVQWTKKRWWMYIRHSFHRPKTRITMKLAVSGWVVNCRLHIRICSLLQRIWMANSKIISPARTMVFRHWANWEMQLIRLNRMALRCVFLFKKTTLRPSVELSSIWWNIPSLKSNQIWNVKLWKNMTISGWQTFTIMVKSLKKIDVSNGNRLSELVVCRMTLTKARWSKTSLVGKMSSTSSLTKPMREMGHCCMKLWLNVMIRNLLNVACRSCLTSMVVWILKLVNWILRHRENPCSIPRKPVKHYSNDWLKCKLLCRNVWQRC